MLMFFMRKKLCANYIELLKFVKKTYKDELGTDLIQKFLYSDAELAFVNFFSRIKCLSLFCLHFEVFYEEL
jgi:hypothetical protein